MRRGLRRDTQQDVLRLDVCVNDLTVTVKIRQTFKHLRQIQVFRSCADFFLDARSTALHFRHTLDVSDLSDDVFDTGERKAWITKTHLPTAQVRPQQLQHQTDMNAVHTSYLKLIQ